MEKFILNLPLSDCQKKLVELQKKLLIYNNRTVQTSFNGFKKRTGEILKELHIGTAWTAYTSQHDLAISFKSQCGHIWITEFDNMEVSITPDTIFCIGILSKEGSPKGHYEFKFS